MVRKIITFVSLVLTFFFGASLAYGYFDKLTATNNSTIQIGEWEIGNVFGGGAGTIDNPYQISNFFHLNNIRNHLTAYFILTTNLDSNTPGFTQTAGETANGGLGWEPIGTDINNSFTGFFDGGGNTISDLYINRPNRDNVGLFGHVGISSPNSPSEIKNISLLNVDITGARGTGALIGRVTGNNQTTIQRVSVVFGTVKGTGETGGLIGSLNSFQPNVGADRNPRLIESYANVSVYGIFNPLDARVFENIGGLVGQTLKGRIQDSYSLGGVTANNGVTNVGGLVGGKLARSFVTKAYSTGLVTVNSGTNIGGFIGLAVTTNQVTGSYWNTQTSGRALGVGSGAIAGVVGLTTAQMTGPGVTTTMNAFNFTSIWQTNALGYPILRNLNINQQLIAQGITP